MTDNHSSDAEFDQWFPEDDQRREYRLTGRLPVEVELASPDPESGEGGRLLSCWSSDVSANGLRVYAMEALPAGALLPVGIQVEGADFFLMAEVKWCRPCDASEDAAYVAGLILFDSDQTAIIEWKEAIARLLAGS